MPSAPLETPPSTETTDSTETSDDPPGDFDLPPELTLAAIRAHEGPIFVDLDETLYLRNSTEDYIDSARPRLLALILLRVIDVLKPWRWTGGEATRDVWRVRSIRLFFPWTSMVWKSRAPHLAQQFTNPSLAAALNQATYPLYIVTVGFKPIVTPLIACLGVRPAQIVACDLTTESRRQGKLACVQHALGEDCVRRAALITDSTEDMPLLQACARGIRTVWPDAPYRRAFADVYLPGQYITQIKHPGEHYLRRAVLQDDYVWWILSSIALTATPVGHIAGLFLLLLSFWVIYEMGYADNDMIASNFEAQPALTRAFHETSVATPVIQPWVWSMAFAVAGLVVIRWPAAPAPKDFLLWTLGLVGTSIWFALYNRANKPTRVWMYGVLQFARTTIFTLIVPILPVGAMALAAQVLPRWAQYYVYRLVGKNWPTQARFGIARLGTFVLLAVLLSIALGWDVLRNWTTLALLGWSVFRARRELTGIFTQSVRLERVTAKARNANDRS